MQTAPKIFILSLLLCAGHVLCFGQTSEETEKTITLEGCGKGVNFQTEGYVVRSSRIDDPFDFLPWVRSRESRAASKIAALVNGKPFLYSTANSQALKIIEEENFLPRTSETRVKIRVEFVTVENCSNRTLDLVYRVYSTQIMPVLSGAPEARTKERESPQEVAGMTNVDVPSASTVNFTPVASYDSTDSLSAGARLEIRWKRRWKLPFNSLVVEGQGSTEMRNISASLVGSADSHGWLAHAEWLLNYANYSLPTGEGNLKGAHLSAQFTGTTRPVAAGNVILRFGGLLEGGNRQSALRHVRLAPDTVAGDGFGAVKLYVGLASRLRHNVFSASYGLELGSLGPAARVDWHKHIGDFRHEFWYPLGDHRILDLESRFTVGRIQIPGKIPLPERFFGGNNEELFVNGDSWQIRANPVIRAIPASRLYHSTDADGGDKFFSYNLTAAYAVWRKPLIPPELTNDDEFNSALENSIAVITGNQQNYYITKDEHYINLLAQLPNVQQSLNVLGRAVQNARAARPGQFETEFRACAGAINTATRRANAAVEANDVVQGYGSVRALLSPSAEVNENRLAKVLNCATELNAALGGDPAIVSATTDLNNIRAGMETEFAQINQALALSKASEDMTFTRRTLSTLFNDVNIYSVSPVFVFDVARLGSERGGFGGIRYGPGAGLRLELASAVHFTAGYAWNIRQRPGEGAGTVFFSLGVRDLFH